ncbi:MAG: hypothetical protein QXI10_02760 [Candidatus Diapherotrites archaeon]
MFITRTDKNKGQGIFVDFFLGAMIFFVVWSLVSVNFWNSLENIKTTSKMQEMEAIAKITLEQLLSSKGSPANWEDKNFNETQKIGLINNSGYVEEKKLVAFSNASINYEELKKKLEINGFDFFFEFYGEDDINAGLEPIGESIKVTEKKQVPYKGGEGIAKLTIYSFK